MIATKKPLARLSVTLTHALVEQLDRTRSRYGVAISGLVEIALKEYFNIHTEEGLELSLRSAGAARRRKQRRL